MTTLHMQTENVHETARQMTQGGEQAVLALRSLSRAVQTLQNTWKGDSSEEFGLEMQDILRRLNTQTDFLLELAGRLDREATEWEVTDRGGWEFFQKAGSNLFRGVPSSIFSGGANSAVIPLFAGLSIGQFLGGLPAWLNSFLDRFFSPAELISPIPEESATIPAPKPPSKTFGDINKETSQASASAETDSHLVDKPESEPAASPPSGYDIYYDIPAKSQGKLYGSAACLPTSLSMITDYYHAKDAANRTISPEGLKDMLDPGDGTSGVGVKLDKLNDDLGELGYTAKNFPSDMDGLKEELANGPVVANIGVRLVSSPARGLDGAGSTNHSVVVRGVASDGGILINDPWSGSEIKLTTEEFSAMWSKGEHWMQTVRP